MITLTQISPSPFEPIPDFRIFSTDRNSTVKLKDQMKQEGQNDERTGKADRREAR